MYVDTVDMSTPHKITPLDTTQTPIAYQVFMATAEYSDDTPQSDLAQLQEDFQQLQDRLHLLGSSKPPTH